MSVDVVDAANRADGGGSRLTATKAGRAARRMSVSGPWSYWNRGKGGAMTRVGGDTWTRRVRSTWLL